MKVSYEYLVYTRTKKEKIDVNAQSLQCAPRKNQPCNFFACPASGRERSAMEQELELQLPL